jgi:iron complex outermembrane receptor protein
MRNIMLCGASALALIAVGAPTHAFTEEISTAPDTVVVTGERPAPDLKAAPSPRSTIDAVKIAETINAVNVEDALRYSPDILVRKRHPGDTQDPITTRTSGVGSSARSLIYADGVLLSALIGNNNSAASPRWGLVAPEEVSRIEVLYGPFAAAYPGNSIGAVVNITTRMPDHLEASVAVTGALQDFSQYGKHDTYPTAAVSAILGDRVGPWRFWLSETHSDTRGQPLTYVELVRPSTTSAAGVPVTGAYADGNKLGQPVAVLGASGLEHQVQDNAKLKLSYDLPGGLVATYSLGLFNQSDHSSVQSYLTSAGGAPVYAGSLNSGGYNYNVANSAFSNGVYHLDERHYGQSLSLRSGPGVFAWDAVVTAYDFGKDIQRTAGAALPGGFSQGTAGTISRLDGTGWTIADVRGAWRPFGPGDERVLTFGAHTDRFVFKNPKYATADWVSGPQGALASFAQGKTQTNALWVQGEAPIAPALKLILGARYEGWRAYEGANYSASPALNVNQPGLDAAKLSPKAALEWRPWDRWTFSARYGRAYRFPTVTELYQSVTTGAVLSVPNPNLKPERADSFDLSAERTAGAFGKARLSLFRESIRDDLISQSAPLVAGSPTLYSYVQNVGRVSTNGAELVSEGLPITSTLSMSGSVTLVDAKVKSDRVFAAAVGKRLPQLPRLRSTLVATWRPSAAWTATLAGRYAGREYANLDNSDTYANTYGAFSGFFVADARVRWRASRRWSLAVGVDNLLDRKYFLFHPFTQRTVLVEVKASY